MLCFLVYLFTRRSGSNFSGLSSDIGMDDQSVNVRVCFCFCEQALICIDLSFPLLVNTPQSPDPPAVFLLFFQFDELSLASNPESPQPLELEPVRQRRTRIPDKPNYYLNLWSIMKNCIGKELSKIPMPVRNLYTCWHSSVFFLLRVIRSNQTSSLCASTR